MYVRVLRTTTHRNNFGSRLCEGPFLAVGFFLLLTFRFVNECCWDFFVLSHPFEDCWLLLHNASSGVWRGGAGCHRRRRFLPPVRCPNLIWGCGRRWDGRTDGGEPREKRLPKTTTTRHHSPVRMEITKGKERREGRALSFEEFANRIQL